MKQLIDEWIKFKSDLDNFILEECDSKNNTVRRIDWNDKRFALLNLMRLTFQYGGVYIVCDDTSKTFFRRIRNIVMWEDLMIITWFPKK